MGGFTHRRSCDSHNLQRKKSICIHVTINTTAPLRFLFTLHILCNDISLSFPNTDRTRHRIPTGQGTSFISICVVNSNDISPFSNRSRRHRMSSRVSPGGPITLKIRVQSWPMKLIRSISISPPSFNFILATLNLI